MRGRKASTTSSACSTSQVSGSQTIRHVPSLSSAALCSHVITTRASCECIESDGVTVTSGTPFSAMLRHTCSSGPSGPRSTTFHPDSRGPSSKPL